MSLKGGVLGAPGMPRESTSLGNNLRKGFRARDGSLFLSRAVHVRARNVLSETAAGGVSIVEGRRSERDVNKMLIPVQLYVFRRAELCCGEGGTRQRHLRK